MPSSAALRAFYSGDTDEAILVLIRIMADGFSTVRVTSDNVETVSNGATYQPYPFTITLPAQRSGEVDRAQLSIDNIDRRLVQQVRTISSGITVEIDIVLASSPDTIEAGPYLFSLQSVTWDALTLTGELGMEDILNEPFPAQTFTPAEFPGLF